MWQPTHLLGSLPTHLLGSLRHSPKLRLWSKHMVRYVSRPDVLQGAGWPSRSIQVARVTRVGRCRASCLPGSAGATATVRRTLASIICRIADPMLIARPRQLCDAHQRPCGSNPCIRVRSRRSNRCAGEPSLAGATMSVSTSSSESHKGRRFPAPLIFDA